MVHVWFVFALALLLNIVLGNYRLRYKKMSFMWFLMIHASLIVILPLRIYLGVPSSYSFAIIGIAILGQTIGTQFLRKR